MPARRLSRRHAQPAAMIEHGTVTGNAIGSGLRPCGACAELAERCGHYNGGKPAGRAPKPPSIREARAARQAEVDEFVRAFREGDS